MLQSKRQTQITKISKHSLNKATTTQGLYFTSWLFHCSASSPKSGLNRLYTELYSQLICEIKYLQLQCPGGAQTLPARTVALLLRAGKMSRGREQTYVIPCSNIMNTFTLAQGLLRAGGCVAAALGCSPALLWALLGTQRT